VVGVNGFEHSAGFSPVGTETIGDLRRVWFVNIPIDMKLLAPALMFATVACATDESTTTEPLILDGRSVVQFERNTSTSSFTFEVDLETFTINGTKIEKLANGLGCMVRLPTTSLEAREASALDEALQEVTLVTSTEDSCRVPIGQIETGIGIDGFGVTVDGTQFAAAPACKQLVTPSNLAGKLDHVFESRSSNLPKLEVAFDGAQWQATGRPCP
jgi:hypothetical protein